MQHKKRRTIGTQRSLFKGDIEMKKALGNTLITITCIANTTALAIIAAGMSGIDVKNIVASLSGGPQKGNITMFLPDEVEGKIIGSRTIPEEGSIVTTVEIDSAISQIGEIATVSYSYSGIAYKTDSRRAFDQNVPLTEYTVEVAYEGVIRAGYVMSDIDYHIDDENRIITFRLPEAQVFSNEITDYDDICDDNIFNRIPPELITDLIMDSKEDELEEAIENGLFLEASESAQSAIREVVTGLCDYEVEFSANELAPEGKN